MKSLIFGVANVCLFFCIAASAQSKDPAFVKARLETVVESYTANHAFMGNVLVVEGDNVLLEKGYGMASLEWNIPNAADVKFRICSVTKQFTAALVLQLQQDGKLNIADPVSKYLPDAPKSWEKITLLELLNHTSGIPGTAGDPAWAMSEHTPAEGFALFRDKPLDFEPGSMAEYSNANYLVLGLVIEKVTGQKYVDVLHQRILDPLGMKDSGLDTDELILPKRAQGYMPVKNGVIAARTMSMSVPWAAGSIYSTTGDLLLWEHGLFDGKVLNDASLKEMTAAGKGDFGLGVMVDDEDGLKIIRHDGGIQGFAAQLTYVPERKLAVIVLGNVYGPAPAAMGVQLLDVALGKPVVLASERKAVPIAQDELAKFTGVYDVAPGFAITITVGGESLMAQAGQAKPMHLMYQGVTGGHPRFYLPKEDAELEFVPDATGTVTSLVLHQGGDHPAKKR